MAVTLGFGDSFHLIPRAYALCPTGLSDYVFALGIGKFITSITMTVFYILLYYVWTVVIGYWDIKPVQLFKKDYCKVEFP